MTEDTAHQGEAGRGRSDGRAQPDAADRWREEAHRNLQRMTNFATLVLDSTPPALGRTPREEIYRKRTARLYRYASPRTRRTPLLFVPNLGISRPDIFDLMPGASFVEHMTRQGFDFYLLDWGTFGPEDNDLTIEDCVVRILPRMAKKVLETSGSAKLSVLGYCMGAPLAVCAIALEPDLPVANLINMAGPIDFSKAGLFGTWLDKKYFHVDRVVDSLGQMPAEMIKAGFKILKPTMDLSTGLNLWWNLWNKEYVEGYKALSHWANTYVPMPGEFFREWVKAFYQENRLVRGELRYGGRPVRLASISCPVLAVGAKEDYIVPPDSVKALIEAVSSDDSEYVELAGGHISLIAGRSAPVHCWPRVAGWLAARS
jgi:polyhydroxyalkanoate synthase